jgi:hypothetical protein
MVLVVRRLSAWDEFYELNDVTMRVSMPFSTR